MSSKIKDRNKYSSCLCPLFHCYVPLVLDQQPGDIEVLTDLLIENYKNFPEARQLGEESARFIRQEMEATWGQSHLAVLSEDEAQRWLLGVCKFFPGSSLILLFRIHIIFQELRCSKQVITYTTHS